MTLINWKEKYGEWALVTGASSGIGRAFALDLASRGMNIILVARNRKKLEQVAAECESLQRKTYLCSVDLTQPNAVQKLYNLVSEKEVGVLINNAGIVARGAFWDIDLQCQLDMVMLHCSIPIGLTHYFLNSMLARNKGAIINISSLSAYFFQPLITTYAAAKEFEWRFSQSLAWELKETGIDILTVVPGFTKTEAFDRANWEIDYDSLPFFFQPQTPQKVSKKSLDILGKKRSIIVASPIEKFIVNASYLLPNNIVEFILAKLFN